MMGSALTALDMPPLPAPKKTILALSALATALAMLAAPQLIGCTQVPDVAAVAGSVRAIPGPQRLNGQWDFFWGEFVEPGSTRRAGAFVTVPGGWAGTMVGGLPVPAKGFATYRLTIQNAQLCPCRVHLPAVGSAYALYADRALIARSGRPGRDRATTVAFFRPQLSDPIPPAAQVTLTWHVANFQDRSGGPWQAPRFGKSWLMERYRENQLALDLFLAGSLLIMALYHAGLFVVRRSDPLPILFAAFCMVMALRSLTEGEKFLFERFPQIDWELQVRISYATFYCSGPLFTRYFLGVFPGRAGRWQFQASFVAFGVLLAVVFATPVGVFTETLPVAHAFTGLFFVISLAITLHATVTGKPEGVAFLAGVLIFGGTVVHDMLIAYALVDDAVLSPFGFFFFVSSQAFLLSARFSRALHREEVLARELSTTNDSLQRFVPGQFLDILEKTGLHSVRPGDHVQRRMTVLFSDIRAFTELSEGLTPVETFNFLNSYLRRMEPSIHEHGGFIDKFIGDGIMALFAGASSRAIDAAISMQRSVTVFNAHRSRAGYRPVSVGMGIHVGDLTLGVIGTARRLEGTVVSDAVNLAARIESLTRAFGAQILISEDTFQSLDDPDRYRYRALGSLAVRGKTKEVTVIEILDGRSRADCAFLLATKPVFERGYQALATGDPDSAFAFFSEALAENPDDQAARYYTETLRPPG